jgi:hypothetical protein
MHSIVPKIFLLYAIGFAGMTPDNSQPANSKVKKHPDTLQQIFTVKQILSEKRSQPDSTDEERMAKRLADELDNIGIKMNQKDIESLTEGMSKGGKSAMALAQFLIVTIAEQKKETAAATLSEQQLNAILQNCKNGKNANLALSQFLVPRFSLLKEKNKKNKN